MKKPSHWKILVLGLSVSAAAVAAVPEVLARPQPSTFAAIDPAVPLTPAAAPGSVAPDATPAVAVRRQAASEPPLRLARAGQSRSDAAADDVATRFELPVPGALALFGSGLLGLLGVAVSRRRRPQRRAA